ERELTAHDVTPLHHGHCVVAGEVFEAEVDELLHAIEPVDVGVHHEQTTAVLAREGERGAEDRRVDVETAREAPRERRLAGTEIASEQHDVTRREQRRDAPGERIRRGRRCDRDDDGGGRHDGADRARARFTTTKSARVWASATPPPRSTAAGCSVGTSTAPDPCG